MDEKTGFTEYTSAGEVSSDDVYVRDFDEDVVLTKWLGRTENEIRDLIDDLVKEQRKVFRLQEEVARLRFWLYVTMGVLVGYILGNIIWEILK